MSSKQHRTRKPNMADLSSLVYVHVCNKSLMLRYPHNIIMALQHLYATSWLTVGITLLVVVRGMIVEALVVSDQFAHRIFIWGNAFVIARISVVSLYYFVVIEYSLIEAVIIDLLMLVILQGVCQVREKSGNSLKPLKSQGKSGNLVKSQGKVGEFY